MRILNRGIAACALVVPMALGASGIAAADVAADGSVLPTQIGASEDDCDGEGDGFARILDIFGDRDESDGVECGGENGGGDNGLPG